MKLRSLIYTMGFFFLLQSGVWCAQPPASTDAGLTLEGSLGLRDPFQRPALKTAIGVNEGGNVPPLERFSIDQFKLVGVITGAKKNKALVTTPDGKMHIVTENMRIGARRGIIKKISPGIIYVEEKVMNLLGQEEKIETVLQFKEKDKDKERL